MADIILGIESSCDDTSAAIIKDRVLMSNVIASQAVHKSYGGVVPELASRAHEQNIVPVISEAISQAGIQPEDISAIAFPRGPGLLGSLLVGTSFAKALAIALDKPLVMVNHLQGHILASFVRQEGVPVHLVEAPCDGGLEAIREFGTGADIEEVDFAEYEIVSPVLEYCECVADHGFLAAFRWRAEYGTSLFVRNGGNKL